jgi:hypothetical protein
LGGLVAHLYLLVTLWLLAVVVVAVHLLWETLALVVVVVDLEMAQPHLTLLLLMQ